MNAPLELLVSLRISETKTEINTIDTICRLLRGLSRLQRARIIPQETTLFIYLRTEMDRSENRKVVECLFEDYRLAELWRWQKR